MQIAMGVIPDDLAQWLMSNPRAMSKLRRMQRSAAA